MPEAMCSRDGGSGLAKLIVLGGMFRFIKWSLWLNG